MKQNININLKNVEAFSQISASNLREIEKNAEFLKYSLGQPICNKDVIPNKVLLIITGEGRLYHGSINQSSTITILSAGSFIGLISILRANGCEQVSASSDLLVMSIPDQLIIKIYQEDSYFKHWCHKNFFPAEAFSITEEIYKKIPKENLTLNQLFKLVSSNSILKIIEKNQIIESKQNHTILLSSSNLEKFKCGDTINDGEEIKVKGPLPVRFYLLPNQLINKFYKDLKVQDKETANTKNIVNLDNISINEKPDVLDISNEKLGQYSPNKNFKIIKASGIIREVLACLQMLAQELDLPLKVDTIEKILRDTIRRNKRPSIELLGGITSMMGLYTSTAKVDPKMGCRLPTPSIISWKNSFAIIRESNSNGLKVIAPSEGEIIISPNDLERNFESGFIELLLVEKNEQTPESKFGLRWLLPSINRYKGALIQVFLASFVVQLIGLANPLMMQVIIDKVISQRSLDTLQILGIALVVITILGGVMSSLRTFLFNETTNRIDTRLGSEVIDHLLRIPLGYFDRRPVGELGSRIAELEKIRNFLTGQALTTILDAIFSLIYIVVMVIYSWLLTLIALAVVPIQILITVIGTPLIRRQIREIAQENAKTQSHLIEVLTGIQTVKAQNVERVSRWKWQELYSKYISKSFQKTVIGTALGETSQVLQQLSQLLVLWIGASLVLNSQLTLGQLIAFRIISGYVTQPLLRLSTIWQNIQELRVSFERLSDIVDTPEESNASDKAKIPLPSIDGSVQFENLNFSFKRGQASILKNINLKIKAGQFVGIVGQSGSGKSTLVKLLPRLYKPNSGRIKIDGYDIDKVELYSLRRQIGIVPQEPLLFAGTITENIALTDPEASSDEIVRVSKIADAHDFVMQLQDGYSTNVGERGAGLSGGQKQRLAIARTLLSNPKLLIMDEATSALDYETERRVCEGIRNSAKGSTVFFITHRLSTVRNSDIIIMLHQGSIVEVGSHDQLMELKGRYFALYRQQESS